jgi:16S rRNA (guanine527-N7)-methyltransferase
MLPEGGESPPERFLPLLAAGARAFGIPLPPERAELLALYLARLDRERRRTNLTGPFPSEELAAHALESAVAAPLVPAGIAVDVGSGAGFPGIPIAVLRPDVSVLPVEPRRLRREFLDGCGRDLPLPNLLPSRASLARVEPGSAAAAFARAVAPVGGLASTIGPGAFLRPGGVFLAWTTAPGLSELARALAPAFAEEGALPVPGTDRKVVARFRRRG